MTYVDMTNIPRCVMSRHVTKTLLTVPLNTALPFGDPPPSPRGSLGRAIVGLTGRA